MAIWLTIKDDEIGRDIDEQFHLGQHIPNDVRNATFEVCADGDELEYIRNEFKNIPMTRGRIVTWKGDDAKFIATNIEL